MTVIPLIAALALLPHAQAPATLHAQGPAAAVARIDFRALTADGQPVTDLKPSEVTLTIGGKAREIRSVELTSGAEAPGAPTPANPPYATNTGAADAPRTVLLVIDDESINPGREQSITAALGRLASGVPARDRVGLLSVRRGGLNIPPSTDRAPVRAAIDGLRGQSSSASDENFACRTQVTLQTLEALLSSTSNDAPTTIVFISASLSAPGEGMARMRSRSDTSGSVLCRLTPEDFERVGTAAAGSRAQLYVVQAIDGTTMSPSEAGPGIENIAGVAGIDTLRLTSGNDTVAERILREMSASYTVSFVPEPDDRTESALPLEVKVTRAGVTAVAPSRISLPKPARTAKTSPRDMIRVATVFTDLPLRAAGYSSRGKDDKLKIIALFEAVEPTVKLTEATIGLFAPDGKLTAQWSAQKGDFDRSPVTAALTVAPGTYRMRVAAVDGAGRSGTADYTLDAELVEAGPLTLSTLVIGAPVAGSFAPQLHFTAKDAAGAGYLEIYGVPKGAQVGVTLEIAPSEDAPAMGAVPAQVVAGDTDDMRRAVGGFSIENLPAGDHVMRAIVSVDGKPVGRAVRTLRKAGS